MSTSSCARPRRLLEFVLFLGFACSVRAVRTWKHGAHYSPTSCTWQPFLGVWVLHVDYGTLDSSGDDFVRGAMVRQWIRGLRQYWALEEFHTFSTSTWARILAFFSVLTQNGEECSVDASI